MSRHGVAEVPIGRGEALKLGYQRMTFKDLIDKGCGFENLWNERSHSDFPFR